MGGQACILYGGAEFSKDVDFAVLLEDNNLDAIRSALTELQAQVIAVPPFERRWLEIGLAVHFRCGAEEVAGFRIDIMSHMRGVDAFDELWARRNEFELADGLIVSALSVPDLITTKKTQRPKDWPMIKRLVEVDYFRHRDSAPQENMDFWLLELRDPDLLLEASALSAVRAGVLLPSRPLLEHAIAGERQPLALALDNEEQREREADRRYWAPLRKTLEDLRLHRDRGA